MSSRPAIGALALACALACACGHGARPAATFRPPPHLPPPPPSDPSALGHAYLEKIGARLQADWGAFLEDLRLRLPPTDPLNDARLAVEIDCEVTRDGAVRGVHVTPSGSDAFDWAAVELLGDAAPLAPPPLELLSDDDTVHLHWRFARDRRQAGVAGARIDRVAWPIERAVPSLLAKGDLAEAARRVAAAAAAQTPSPALAGQAEAVFDAAIALGLASSDVSVRRDASAAVEAIHSRVLAAQVRALARGDAFDVEVRMHAIAALGAAMSRDGADDDKEAHAILLDVLAHGPDLPPPITATTARTIAAAGGADAVARDVVGWLAPDGGHAPSAAAIAAALAAMSASPAPQAVPAVRHLLAAADPMTRGAACAALAASAAEPAAWAAIVRGLGDPDATVRAACTEAAGRAVIAAPAPRAAYPRIAALLRDRDERVRAAAAIAAVAIDARRAATDLRALPAEKSAAVRAAQATAWGRVPGATPPALAVLAGDDDAEVRAAAVAALAGRDDPDARGLAARMAPDPDAAVRLAAVAAIADADGLAGLVTDDDPQVRTAALDRDAQLRGRAGSLAARATALAAAPRGSIEQVRLARSWLLAR